MMLALAGPVAAQQVGPAGRVYEAAEVDQLPALPGSTPHRKPAPVRGQYIRYVNTEDLSAAVQKHLVLPAAVLHGQAEGTVSLTCEVSATGLITHARVLNRVCPTCDTAALVALRRLPRLQPARYHGQPVAVAVVVHVKMVWPDHVYTGYEYSGYFAYVAPERLYHYLKQHMRLPAAVAANKIQGRVRVGFIVRRTGQIEAAEITSSLCPSCDAEALRLVRGLPRWTPGHNPQGQPVVTRQFVDIPMPLPNPALPYVAAAVVRNYASQKPALLDGRRNLGGAIAREVQYSAAMRKDTVRGYVGLEFVVDANGIVRQPRITRSRGPLYDSAVLAVLARLGPLIPAQEYHQPQPYLEQVRVFINPRLAPAGTR